MGWYTPELTTAKTRLQGEAVEIVTFMLNATLFVLVGLELRPIVESLGDRSTGTCCCGPRGERNGDRDAGRLVLDSRKSPVADPADDPGPGADAG